MLSYPPGVPGAVSITSGDFRQLQPGQYLNDNLIEYGLKCVLSIKFIIHSDMYLGGG